MNYLAALVFGLFLTHVTFGQERPPQAPPIPDPAAARIAYLEARIAALEAAQPRYAAPQCDPVTGCAMPNAGYYQPNYQQGSYQQGYYQQGNGGSGRKCGPVRRALGRCK